MSLITKMLKKYEVFAWTKECQNAWEELITGMYKPLF
jgi:lysyl-tRNA synthetase class II